MISVSFLGQDLHQEAGVGTMTLVSPSDIPASVTGHLVEWELAAASGLTLPFLAWQLCL